MRTKKISLLLALVLVISAIALPLTAYAAGDKDTTPPELAASLDGGTLKVESSDDNSGVEAVFVDGNRIRNPAGTITAHGWEVRNNPPTRSSYDGLSTQPWKKSRRTLKNF